MFGCDPTPTLALPLKGRGYPLGRVILLDAAAPDGARRYLSALPALALDGDKPRTWVTLTRMGKFNDPVSYTHLTLPTSP
jgi:hypothetical protein